MSEQNNHSAGDSEDKNIEEEDINETSIEKKEVKVPKKEEIQVSKDLIDKLNPLQKAGVDILYKVGFVATAIIVFIFVFSFVNFQEIDIPETPKTPQNNSKTEIEQYQLAIDQYERLINLYHKNKTAQQERANSLFQMMIINALLPIFTSVLGYIFGSQSRTSDSDSDS
jgi:cytochrome c-type biogenesis protein CcmH/NrfG